MSTTSPPLHHHHHTFWCHECEMSISLSNPPPPTPPPTCPHCHSNFLEQMDTFTPPLFPQFPNDPSSPLTPTDDNFLLDSPYLHRLIHHLTTTPPPATTSKSAVTSLTAVKITSLMLDNDPFIPCPICKDTFLLEMEVKMLPCKHMYHADCIYPWLEINNTCPVCRFMLPIAEVEAEEDGRGEGFIGEMSLEELLGEEEDLFGFRRTLRRVARRHQLAGQEYLLSQTQIGETGSGVDRANSVETVSSSWPRLVVENGIEGEVGGGEGDTVVRS